MLAQLTILLVCQLAGEVIARYFGLPVPGPVVGLVLMLALLALRGGIAPEMERTAGGLLDHLSLLFVPAGVGVMLHLPLIAAEWPAIAAAVIGSTVLTILVTAAVMAWLTRAPQTPRADEHPGGNR